MKKVIAIIMSVVLVLGAFVGGYFFAIHSVRGAVETKDGYMIDFNGQIYDYCSVE